LLGRTVIVVIMFLRLSGSIFGRENGLSYFTYVALQISLFRLSVCFYISIAFLYFLGKYDVIVAVIINNF